MYFMKLVINDFPMFYVNLHNSLDTIIGMESAWKKTPTNDSDVGIR